MIPLTTLIFSTALLRESDLEKGIQLVMENRYEDALDVLSAVDKETPNDALTNLWLGLAYQGAKQPHEAMRVWRVSFGNPKWEPVADTLRGYGWWALGDARYAELTFKEALVNLRDGKVIRFKPATDGLAALASGAPVPTVAKWIDRLGLVEATKKTLSPEDGAPEEAEKPVDRPKAEPPVDAEPKAPKGANVRPVAGEWIAKRISGGYNDGKILFTVSADGKRITDVVFVGHWYDRERRHTEPVTTGPEKPYTIASGAWGGLQTNSKAGFGWEFSGRLTGPRTAVGSFRGYAAGIYDTGTVQWKAAPAK